MSKNKITLLQKGALVTLLTQVGEWVGKHDPRAPQPICKEFPSNDAAADALNFAISTSQLRGWSVAWHGPQLNHPHTS